MRLPIGRHRWVCRLVGQRLQPLVPRPFHWSSFQAFARKHASISCLPTVPKTGAVGFKRHLSTSAPASVEGWWKASTDTLLDGDVHPVGSLNTLLWHKAETLIVYWADDRSKAGLDYCFRIIDRLAEEIVLNPHDSFVLNIYLIHAVLNTWNKQFQKFHTNMLPSQILEKMEGYLAKAPGLFEPNVATYTIILDGASYCPNPVERIGFTERLLQWLIDESEKNPQVRPTAVTLGTVLKGLSKSGSRQGAAKAEGLLRRMIDLQNTEQFKDVEVNTIHYTTVLQAHANAGEPESAQRLLMEMLREAIMNGKEQVRPNIRSFNAVLSAWSKSSSSDAYDISEELFRRVVELHENGVLKEPPNTVSYNCLLTALAKRSKQVLDPVTKAEALVEDLLRRLASNPTDSSFEPTQVTFTLLFRILEASNHPEKHDKVEQWLQAAKRFGLEVGQLGRDYKEGNRSSISTSRHRQ